MQLPASLLFPATSSPCLSAAVGLLYHAFSSWLAVQSIAAPLGCLCLKQKWVRLMEILCGASWQRLLYDSAGVRVWVRSLLLGLRADIGAMACVLTLCWRLARRKMVSSPMHWVSLCTHLCAGSATVQCLSVHCTAWGCAVSFKRRKDYAAAVLQDSACVDVILVCSAWTYSCSRNGCSSVC